MTVGKTQKLFLLWMIWGPLSLVNRYLCIRWICCLQHGDRSVRQTEVCARQKCAPDRSMPQTEVCTRQKKMFML